jgi:hypothetical protein
MTHSTPKTLLPLLLASIPLALAQSSGPTTPSKEYIHLGGQTVVIENATPTTSFSPTTLTFGGEPVGTPSNPQPITLTNNGVEPMTFSSITLSGANPGDFSFNTTCTSTLAVGAKCTVTVTFTPTATGTRAATLLFSDSAPGAPQSVTLNGTGGAPSPVVTLSAPSLSLVSENVGTTSPAQTLTITNSGTAALTITSFSLTGSNPSDFSAGNCRPTLAAGAVCGVNVTFTPTAIGARSAQISIADNAAGSPQTIALTGTGLGPAITLSTATVNFGNQNVNASGSQSLIVSNSGNLPLTITSVNTGSAFFGATAAGNCTSIAPQTNCSIALTFTPNAEGGFSATLSIADNAPGSPQSVALSGTGLAAGISLNPTSVPFGNQNVGPSTSQTITVTNTGNSALAITAVTIAGSSFFKASPAASCASIAPQATCPITVTFTPTASGAVSANLSIADNAAGSPHVVPLSGTGTAPAISFNTTALTFTDVSVGNSATHSVTVTNSGTAPLTISSVSISPSGGPFSTSQNPCAGAIAPNATCSVSVTFTPNSTTPSPANATLLFNDNAPASPQSVSLSGTVGACKKNCN